MILLDAYALIAYLRDEAAAGTVQSLLRSGGCVINAVNFAEALDVLARVQRLDMQDIAEAISGLIGGPLLVTPIDETAAWRAAAIRSRHYHRKERALSLADCLLIACAGPDDQIATADADVAGTAHSEGISVRTLPARDS